MNRSCFNCRGCGNVPFFASLLVLLPAASRLLAEEPAQTYTDPAHVDESYAYQGEFSGTISTDEGDMKLGVQVVALGKNEFASVAYLGGLPGDGWNREPTLPGQGKRNGDQVELRGARGSGVVKGDTLRITGGSGAVLGTLARVRRESPTLGAKPPAGASVLFDGTEASLQNWKGGRMSDDGFLMQGTTSRKEFGDHRLHLEFRLAYQPDARGQQRSNSGVYLQGRYEVQILDSFGLKGEQNECGGVYSVGAPRENMCFPPLTWQTYDIDFTAAKFDAGGTATQPPRMTVRHNGVVIHDKLTLPADRSTTAAPVPPGPEPGPVYLQDHSCPLRFRNVWVLEL